MVRYELNIKGTPISIAYGFDEFVGISLSVFDSRLETNVNASKEVNRACESIGVQDGGGGYFDLHTIHGFGMKVSTDTILVFLRRYGVTEESITTLLRDANQGFVRVQI